MPRNDSGAEFREAQQDFIKAAVAAIISSNMTASENLNHRT